MNKHDLLDLIDYHERKAKQKKSPSAEWEEGQKYKYRFHVRSFEILSRLKEGIYGCDGCCTPAKPYLIVPEENT